MGWSSGSSIFSEIIDCLLETDIDDDSRESIYNKLIEVFVDYDCDTLYECMKKDPVFDKCLNELYPEDEYIETDENEDF